MSATWSEVVYDNHTAALVEDIVPALREAYRLGGQHPDFERLIEQARTTTYAVFEGTEVNEEAVWWIWRVLCGVAGWMDDEPSPHNDRPSADEP